MDCSFCYRTTPQERAKSPEKLDNELSVLKSEHNIEFVFFVDLTFTSHKKQTMEILDVIKKHDIRWTCLTRCADIDKDRADMLAIIKDEYLSFLSLFFLILLKSNSLSPNKLKSMPVELTSTACVEDSSNP